MVFNFYIHTTVEELGINTFFGLLKENAEAKWLTNNKTKQPPPTPPNLFGCVPESPKLRYL